MDTTNLNQNFIRNVIAVCLAQNIPIPNDFPLWDGTNPALFSLMKEGVRELQKH